MDTKLGWLASKRDSPYHYYLFNVHLIIHSSRPTGHIASKPFKWFAPTRPQTLRLTMANKSRLLLMWRPGKV